MNTAVVEVSKETAERALEKYRAQNRRQYDDRDALIVKGYEAIKKGQQVIQLISCAWIHQGRVPQAPALYAGERGAAAVGDTMTDANHAYHRRTDQAHECSAFCRDGLHAIVGRSAGDYTAESIRRFNAADGLDVVDVFETFEDPHRGQPLTTSPSRIAERTWVIMARLTPAQLRQIAIPVANEV